VQIQSANPESWESACLHIPAWYEVTEPMRQRFATQGSGGMVQVGQGHHGPVASTTAHDQSREVHHDSRLDDNFYR
jgi:hypothetical protein